MEDQTKKKNLLLYAARKKHCWTLEVASEKANVHVTTYSRWESGDCEPTLTNLSELCKGFGMTPQELGYAHLVQVLTPTRRSQVLLPKQTIADLLSEQVDLLEVGMLAFALAHQQYQWTTQDLQAHLEDVRKRIEAMLEQNTDHDGLTRRQAMTLLSGLPLALLGLTFKDSNLPVFGEDLLPLCATSIPACWELYHDGGIAEVERMLPVYRAKLSALARNLATPYYKQAASFASQVYQLSSQVAKGQESFGQALEYCKDALTYAQLAEDPNLQMATLIRKADIFFFRNQPVYALKTYEEALPLLKNVTPLLQGRVYAGLAETHARRGAKQEALRFMGLAHEHYPAHPEQDPAFAYTRHSHHSLYVYAGGLTHLHLGNPKKALESFTHVEKNVLKPKAMVTQRVELAYRKATTFVALGDLPQSCLNLEQTALSSKEMGLRLYFNQAFDLYQHLPEKWYSETAVKGLEAHFQPW